MLWCKGKRQNETMMLTSNYANRLAGVAAAAKAGAGYAYIIICKLDCKLKWLNMFKKPFLKGKYVQQKLDCLARFSVFCPDRMLIL